MTDFTPDLNQLRIISEMLQCDYDLIEYQTDGDNLLITVNMNDIIDWDHIYNCDDDIKQDLRYRDNKDILKNIKVK